MIKLLTLLREIQSPPKALILAGAPGAGKGSILKDLDLSGLKTLNLDDEIIKLSKELGFTLNQKDTDNENRSAFMKAMAQATSNLKNKILPQVISKKESFILDGTAASLKNTLELKQQLESLGYEVMMLYVYTDLSTSLERNEKRFEKSGGEDRSLMPNAILGTWKSVTQNFDVYKREFGKNFVSVANTGNNESMTDITVILRKYVEPWRPTDGAEKDEKAQARSEKNKEKLKQELDSLLKSKDISNIINSSVSKDEAQQKINQFLK